MGQPCCAVVVIREAAGARVEVVPFVPPVREAVGIFFVAAGVGGITGAAALESKRGGRGVAVVASVAVVAGSPTIRRYPILPPPQPNPVIPPPPPVTPVTPVTPVPTAKQKAPKKAEFAMIGLTPTSAFLDWLCTPTMGSGETSPATIKWLTTACRTKKIPSIWGSTGPCLFRPTRLVGRRCRRAHHALFHGTRGR